MSRRENLKRKIIEKIDENYDPWVKAAFYSDREVSILLDELYRRWEEAGMEGKPLDYASDEELEFLALKAEAVKPIHATDKLTDMMYRAMTNREPPVVREERPSVWKFLKRLILPGD